MITTRAFPLGYGALGPAMCITLGALPLGGAAGKALAQCKSSGR
jgi:hypothetical protein